MSSTPKISVVILNWNQWGHTLRCLATLFQSTYENFDVILVENGSTDDSLSKIKEWLAGQISGGTKFYPEDPGAKPVKVIELCETDIKSSSESSSDPARSLTIIKIVSNLGFARACNLGMKYALRNESVKYILTLNNDMEINPESVSHLVAAAEKDPMVGAGQAKVLLSESPGFIDGVGVKVTWYGAAFKEGSEQADKGQYDSCRKIFGAYPAATLYRCEMLKQVGLFDEDFFVYYEDVDHCLRMRKTPWITVLVPAAVTHHFHSASYGKIAAPKLYYLFRNMIFYAVKNLPFPILMILLFLYYPLAVLVYIARTKGDPQMIKSIGRGAKDGLKAIPALWKKRRTLNQNSKKT